MGGLSVAMLRRHLGAYLGCFVAMALACALMAGALSVTFAAIAGDGLGGAAVAPDEVRQIKQFLPPLGGFLAAVSVLVSISLIASMIAFVVGGRRRELALLRLSGARPGQLIAMVVGEVALLSLVAGLVGCLAAVPVGRGYMTLFRNNFSLPEGLTVNLHLPALLGGILLTVGVAMISALNPARRIAGVKPIEALSEGSTRLKPMTTARWVLGAIGAVGALALFFAPPSLPPEGFLWLALGQGVLALIALVQFAPLVVGPITRLLCRAFTPAAPGASALAQGHASWNAARTASLANPALLLVAVPTICFVTFTGLGHSFEQSLLARLDAGVVAHEPTTAAAAPDPSALDGVPHVRAAVGFWRTDEGWEQREEDGTTSRINLVATDAAALPSVLDVQVRSGDLAAVRGHAVASMTEFHPVGTTVHLVDPQGRPVDATVVAIVDSMPISSNLIVDAATFDLGGAPLNSRTWLVATDGASAEQVTPALTERLGTDTRVETVQAWSEAMRVTSDRQTLTALLIILGGSSLLATLAIGVSIVTSLRERRGEFTLVRRAGAGEGDVLGGTLLESVAVVLVAGALALALLGLVWARIWQNFVATGVPGVPPVPWWILGSFAAVGLAMTLVATLGGTAWALRSIRLR